MKQLQPLSRPLESSQNWVNSRLMPRTPALVWARPVPRVWGKDGQEAEKLCSVRSVPTGDVGWGGGATTRKLQSPRTFQAQSMPYRFLVELGEGEGKGTDPLQ